MFDLTTPRTVFVLTSLQLLEEVRALQSARVRANLIPSSPFILKLPRNLLQEPDCSSDSRLHFTFQTPCASTSTPTSSRNIFIACHDLILNIYFPLALW